MVTERRLEKLVKYWGRLEIVSSHMLITVTGVSDLTGRADCKRENDISSKTDSSLRNMSTVIPRLTKKIRSGITFVSRNVISRRFL